MNTHPLKATFSLSLCAVLGLGAAATGFAATATTDPVGYNTLPLLANSDSYISTPFQRPSSFIGQVASVSGSVITLSGSPGWTASQFVYSAGIQTNTYFAFIRSGTKEGNFYTVTANTANSVTVDLAGDTLAALAAGSSISITPYWTIGTIFPATDVGVSFDNTAIVASRKTEIFLMNLDSTGSGIYPAASLFFYNNAWRKSGRPLTESYDDTIVTPDEFFILRNNTATARTLTATGSVVTTKLASVLRTQTGSRQDNVLALNRPVPVSLNDAALITSGAFEASPSVVSRKDELYVFDNTIAQKSRSASATYFYYNGGWRKVGQPLTTDFGPIAMIAPGSGFVIRKATSAAGASQVWVNTPSY